MQLKTGQDYKDLRASIGLHLLDFDLFVSTDAERSQAIWRFEMRDEGLQEGRKEAKRETLYALLELKFGTLPDWAIVQLNQAELDQLESWITNVLNAESVEILLGKYCSG